MRPILSAAPDTRARLHLLRTRPRQRAPKEKTFHQPERTARRRPLEVVAAFVANTSWSQRPLGYSAQTRLREIQSHSSVSYARRGPRATSRRPRQLEQPSWHLKQP